MGFFDRKCNKCVAPESKNDYKQLAEKLQAEVESLNSKLTLAYNETADSEFSFDFNKVNAFSIERNWSGEAQRPVTIIGYMLSEPVTMTEDSVTTKDVVREWYLYCSKEQHTKLVEQFNKAMEKNNAAI